MVTVDVPPKIMRNVNHSLMKQIKKYPVCCPNMCVSVYFTCALSRRIAVSEPPPLPSKPAHRLPNDARSLPKRPATARSQYFPQEKGEKKTYHAPQPSNHKAEEENLHRSEGNLRYRVSKAGEVATVKSNEHLIHEERETRVRSKEHQQRKRETKSKLT